MVASVAELGYEGTRVADISEISGVSSRSFYNLFPGGKEECFLAVLEQILDGAVEELSRAGKDETDWERRLRLTYVRFAEIVAAQPAAASLLLTEAYAAGPLATESVDRVTGAFERLSRRRLQESPERAGLPVDLLSAQVGALQELARTRLRGGEASALMALIPELVDLVASYRPPPRQLRLSTRRSSFEPSGIISSDEAERAIQGFILAVAEHGYAGATIHEIARHSGMSPNTFYANFRDKRAALLAAIDSSTAQLQALAMAAYRRSPGWASGVRAMIGSALNFLASRPATANILLIEVYAGGSEALQIRAHGIRELTRVISEKARDSPQVPSIAPEVFAGGIVALARRQLLRKGAESLPRLGPVATYITLAPFLGPEEACAVANGDGRARTAAEEMPARTETSFSHSKWIVHGMLGSGWVTADQIAEEIGATEESVIADLESLEKDGLVERISPLEKGEPTEWINTRMHRLVDGDDWAGLTPEERQQFILNATRRAMSQIKRLESESLGRRLDEQYTSLHLELDEEGWSELGTIQRIAFDATQKVQKESARRLRKSEKPMVSGFCIQLLFEAPRVRSEQKLGQFGGEIDRGSSVAGTQASPQDFAGSGDE